MKILDIIVDEKIAQAKGNHIYELLGHFGDRLPDDVRKELYERAERQDKEVAKIRTKISKFYS